MYLQKDKADCKSVQGDEKTSYRFLKVAFRVILDFERFL